VLLDLPELILACCSITEIPESIGKNCKNIIEKEKQAEMFEIMRFLCLRVDDLSKTSGFKQKQFETAPSLFFEIEEA